MQISPTFDQSGLKSYRRPCNGALSSDNLVSYPVCRSRLRASRNVLFVFIQTHQSVTSLGNFLPQMVKQFLIRFMKKKCFIEIRIVWFMLWHLLVLQLIVSIVYSYNICNFCQFLKSISSNLALLRKISFIQFDSLRKVF